MGRLSNSELLELLSRAAGDGEDAQRAWTTLERELGGPIRSFVTRMLARIIHE